MPLPDALALEVERRNLTQREAAEKIGVTQQVLSRWVTGQATPKNEYVPPLAAFLRTSEKRVREMRAATGPGKSNQRIAKLEAEVADLRRLLVAIAARVGVEP